MTRTAVRFEGLVKWYDEVEALRGLSCSVPAGSVTALLGRNGAGKTTALRCLVGLLEPDDGRVLVLGREARNLDVGTRRQIGYVSERQHLDQRLTVGQLMDYTASFYPDWDVALADDLLDRLGLDRQWPMNSLSQGEGRKVALGANLAFRPSLLVLDEPAQNLDAVVRREFLETVLELFRTEGMTVLLSTHLLTDVERVADRVILIENGRLRVQAGLDDLKDRVKALRLIPRNGRPVPEVELPGTLCRRRLGKEILVTVEDYTDGRARAAAEQAGVDVDVVDLPLEEIFIAYGKNEPGVL
jgi:ABC-2 type transport system ATP-binding protein